MTFPRGPSPRPFSDGTTWDPPNLHILRGYVDALVTRIFSHLQSTRIANPFPPAQIAGEAWAVHSPCSRCSPRAIETPPSVHMLPRSLLFKHEGRYGEGELFGAMEVQRSFSCYSFQQLSCCLFLLLVTFILSALRGKRNMASPSLQLKLLLAKAFGRLLLLARPGTTPVVWSFYDATRRMRRRCRKPRTWRSRTRSAWRTTGTLPAIPACVDDAADWSDVIICWCPLSPSHSSWLAKRLKPMHAPPFTRF